MVALLAAAIGLGLYALSSQASVLIPIGVGAGTLCVAGALPAVGSRVGHDRPRFARWLLWAWTPGVLIAAGAVSAISIHLAVVWAAGGNASGQTKAIYGAIVSVLAGAVAQVNGLLEKHLAPWISARKLCRRYDPLFPCLPQGFGPGREAQEALSARCRNRDAANWRGPSVEQLLRLVDNAIRAGEFQGGPNWKCFESPAPYKNLI